MKVLIHASPVRMWYVRDFLIPSLQEQGADEIQVWNDIHRKGNLRACMDSFATRQGHGGTWHIQDDVLICRDFVERCREHDEGVVYGFCNEQFTDDQHQTGEVFVADSWHSFQCVRIPDDYARDCAEWFEADGWKQSPNPEVDILVMAGKGDDTLFREFMQQKHGTETVLNLKPNLVEHVDWIVGGSILHRWRGYLARAYYWEDEDLVDELKEAVKGKVEYV